MTSTHFKKLTLPAMFLALGFILPFFTGQIPEIGSMLLPMHLPIFLCALTCGAAYATPIAVLLPLLRAFIFGRPAPYPDAVAIACELATYALVAGMLFAYGKKHIGSLYVSLLAAMVAGRIVRGFAQLLLLSFIGVSFSLKAFLTGVILTALPGIILQLILIPAIMMLLRRTLLSNK